MADNAVHYLTKTTIGKLKIASAALGFFGMCFVVAATRFWSRIADCPSGTETTFLECIHFWIAAICAVCVILAWIWTVFIFVAIFNPTLNQHAIFPKLDIFGHLGYGISQCIAAILALTFTVNIHEWVCARNPSCGALWLLEWRGVLFILTALVAIVHGVVCILIYIQANRVVQSGRGPVMAGAGTSQAPSTTRTQTAHQADQQSTTPEASAHLSTPPRDSSSTDQH